MNIRFLSRGSPDQISGGYLYNRYLIQYLRQVGVNVTYHSGLTDLTNIGVTDIVVVDSLVIGDFVSKLLPMPARLILLLHVVPRPDGPKTDWDRALKALCRRSRIVVTGDSTLNLLRKLVADPHLDVVKIEPGVPEGWQAKGRYAESARQLLGVANYVRGKGVTRMLAALHQLRHLPWTMRLYGNQDFDPEYTAVVARMLTEYGLADRIELLGPIPHRIVNRKMLEADLLVHFSLRESYSMVTAEAIACGLPVLSYRTGNFNVFRRSGLVRYVDPGRSAEATELGGLIECGETYAQLRPVGRPEARSCQDVGREFLRWLEQDGCRARS